VRPTYSLTVFAAATSNRGTIFTKDLAAEILDTRMHTEYMRNYCGYTGHNESKDLNFCILLADGRKEEALIKHRADISMNKDTPHSLTRGDFIRQMLNPTRTLIEVMDDQASIAGRYFKKKDKMGVPHRKLQDDILTKGVQLLEGGEAYWWNKELFDQYSVPRLLQEKVWELWKLSNERYYKYWTKSFGEFNENLEYLIR